MKVKLALLILVLITSNLFGQRKTKFGTPLRQPIEGNDSIIIENSKCSFHNNFSSKERLSFYPFNKASKIILISYNDASLVENRTPIKDKKIDYSLVKEFKIINDFQIDSLTNILYNVGFKSISSFVSINSASCYNPRNSIVFLNNKDEVMDYIEICFQCNRYETSSAKIKEFEICTTKYDLLKSFFLLSGIKVGTIEEINHSND